MKKLPSLALLSGLLLAITGCADDVAYSRRPHNRQGYYEDRQITTYETRPVYRGDRRVYRDDGYDGHNDVREYDAPSRRHSDVRVTF